MTQYKPPSDAKNFLPRLDTSGSGPPSVSVDLEEFAHFLDDTGWSDDQKADYLQTLWGVMVEFAMLGFGFHPVQQAGNARNAGSGNRDACGKLPESAAPRPDTGADAVKYEQSELNKPFEKAAAHRAVAGRILK
ncbi:hypothetical protein [Thalassobaculum litoreum]|uniref:Uncharacterized protein n=1 Tax=Thalassobaculum litoreum DSM 18839 TaxID=1123362 RepID=A0A8G2BGR1_9PROT|nr:hypothetical protein [Thalassobaculum litoreum]SDF61788.1 hypothetical protein SAMN05660686_01785 [Thalassobaculum litoreum DSM 18839]